MDISFVLSLSIKLIIGCATLLAATIFLGKTQLSQITFFEFISALVLGELLGNSIYEKEINIFYVVYTIFLWSMLMFILKFITLKIKKTRSVFEGNPSIVIKKGKINYEQLKKDKVDINELQSLLRGKGIFSIREVEYAVLEPSGSISVLKKLKYEDSRKEDLNLSKREIYLPITLILEGEVLKDNLVECGFDEEWLRKQIDNKGISEIKDILYADWVQNDGIYIVLYS